MKWYWIVDPALHAIEIYELGADGRYVRALRIGEGRVESVPGCHGLALDLDAMWAEAGSVAGISGDAGWTPRGERAGEAIPDPSTAEK